MSNTQTRIVNFDGEVVVAEKYETITVVKSELDAKAAAIEARRADLNAQADAVTVALSQLEAERAELDEQFALYERAKAEAEAAAPVVLAETSAATEAVGVDPAATAAMVTEYALEDEEG